MKRTETKTFGEVFAELISNAGLDDTYNRQRASFLWPEVVGPTVNRMTTRRYVEGETLHVYISSAPLKSELSFLTQTLLKRINEIIGKEVIKSIVIH